MWYQNIKFEKVNKRNLGIFKVYISKKDMKVKNISGYSVRFRTHKIAKHNFQTQFNENYPKHYDETDEEYGNVYWDFQKLANAEKKLEELKSNANKKEYQY